MDRQQLDQQQLAERRLAGFKPVTSAELTGPAADPTSASGRRNSLSEVVAGNGPIWVFIAALLALGWALYSGVVQQLPTPAGPFQIPWWVLAACFLLTEVAVVHYDFRREAHTFSMNELPLVFGLFFSEPADVVLAMVVGTAVALLVHRRQTGMKLLFNVAHFFVGVSLAVIIFDAISDDTRAFDPVSWLAVVVATVATSALSTAAIFVAISLSERRLELRKLPEQTALAMLTTAGSSSLGLVGVGAAWHDPRAALLLVVPVGTFFLAYRGYVQKRQERESLEFLLRSARILDEAPDVATGISRMLGIACTTFRAELAQFALLSPHEGEVALLVTANGESARTSEHVRLDSIDGLLHRALQSAQSQVLDLNPPAAGPDGHELRQVMIGPLRSEAQTRGAFLVANRLGASGMFNRSDLRLLETLVTQASVSLENGRLARMLSETAQRADREQDKAVVLQRGILPPKLPRLPRTDMAVRYVPAAAGMEVGGDWYDVMRLRDGQIGVAIGDVLGHDLEAAARMGQARSALRAYATEGHAPGAVMARLNRLLIQTDTEFMGTCCYLQLDPDSDLVTLVSAGHPPPILIGTAGRSKLVGLEANLPLGVEERAIFEEVTIELPPGATLVLYTDGLVESRALSLEDGLARVTRTPQIKAREDLETLAEHFLMQAPRDQTDDLTLLLLRNRTTLG